MIEVGSVWEHFGGRRARVACVSDTTVSLIESPVHWPLERFLREWKPWRS